MSELLRNGYAGFFVDQQERRLKRLEDRTENKFGCESFCRACSPVWTQT